MALIRKHHGQNLKEELLQATINNENVNTSCESLSESITIEALSMILKKQFILKWIDIRGSLVCENICTNFEKCACKT